MVQNQSFKLLKVNYEIRISEKKKIEFTWYLSASVPDIGPTQLLNATFK